jgi:hypothetical protein
MECEKIGDWWRVTSDEFASAEAQRRASFLSLVTYHSSL